MDDFFKKIIPDDPSLNGTQYSSQNLPRPNIMNNDITLVGKGWNRWQYLFFDPQKNCIEKFVRGGENSVLHELDHHTKECFETYSNSVKFQ